MRATLTRLLACPDCHRPLGLEVHESQGEEIRKGILDCARCGVSFPVLEGIPRFVSTDALARSFAWEWKRWRRTQFDTADRHSAQSAFLASTGRQPQDFAGKLVLDAGCGAGRYLDLLARAGTEVVGVDLSRAVEVARDNFRDYPNVHLVQADVAHPPFLPGSFDYLYSIGVLHRTPDPRRSFLRLIEAVKPGGEVALWVYPRRRLTEAYRYFPGQVNEVIGVDVAFRIAPWASASVRRLAPALDWIMETSSSLERMITTRLPARWLYLLCHMAIPLYYLYRIPLFFPLRLVTKVAMDPDPEWRVLDTFDWYSPRYQSLHTYADVRSWFEEAGFEQIALLPRPVAVCGRKPGGGRE
jgi:SAM-dependent methyltransferase